MALGNSQTTTSAPNITSDSALSEEVGGATSPDAQEYDVLNSRSQVERAPDPEHHNAPTAKELEVREVQARRERQEAINRSTHLNVPRRSRDVSPAASSIVSASSTGSVDTTDIQEAQDEAEPAVSTPTLPSYDDAVAERPYQGQQFSPSHRQLTYRTMNDQQELSRPSEAHVPTGEDPESQPLLSPAAEAEHGANNSDGNDNWHNRCRQLWRTWMKRNRYNQWVRKLLFLLICVSAATAIISLLASAKGKTSEGDVDEPAFPDIPGDSAHRDAARAAVAYCKSPSMLAIKSGMQWDFPDPGMIEFTQTSVAAFALHNLLQLNRGTDAPYNGPVETSDLRSGLEAESENNRRIRHRGDVFVRRRQSGVGVSVEVGAWYTHRFLSRLTGFAAEASSILLQVPRSTSGQHFDANEDLCMYSFTIIEVEPSYNLSLLAIDTELMSVTVDPSLDLGSGSESINIKSLVGAVDFPGPTAELRSRDIRIETQTGVITGIYPLRDSLTVISKTGLIAVTVDPQEAAIAHELPARLVVESNTGAVTIKTRNLHGVSNETFGAIPKNWPPKRDYHTKVNSLTGTIELYLLHGTQTLVTSHTGQISAVLVPCDDPKKESELEVSSNTGSIHVDILNSIYTEKAVLTNLATTVAARTGSQIVGLPSRWEGRLDGRSVGGGFRVSMSGFVADRSGADPNMPLWYRVSGHRGHGDSSVLSKAVSGTTEWADAIYNRSGDEDPSW